MSPFLFFSNEKRNQLRTEHPELKMTDISSKLGELWRNMTDEERAPYVEKSKEDRDRYKSQQNEFRGKNPQPQAVSFFNCSYVTKHHGIGKAQFSCSCYAFCELEHAA